MIVNETGSFLTNYKLSDVSLEDKAWQYSICAFNFGSNEQVGKWTVVALISVLVVSVAAAWEPGTGPLLAKIAAELPFLESKLFWFLVL